MSIKRWLAKHDIIVMSRNEYLEERRKIVDKIDAINKDFTWMVINPVIHDLEKLRANTWDQDKISKIQNWLIDNFGGEDGVE